MKIYFTKNFKKSYAKRIKNSKNLEKRFEARYDIFVENTKDSQLLDHALTGKLKDHRSFSVTGDIRVVYYIYKNTAYFVDIGTHNQVYGR